MSLDAAFQAALDGPVVGLFAAVEIVHPIGTARLLDGSGVLTFNGHTWVGGDATFGSLGSLDAVSDGSGEEAPTCKLSLLPPDAAAMIAMAVSSAQGSQVSIYVGAFDPSTGQVIGQPDLRFFGKIDTASLVLDADRTVVAFGLVSAFEAFFAADEGAKLSNSFHTSVWPGERGFEYLSNVLDKMPWGVNGVLPALSRGA